MLFDGKVNTLRINGLVCKPFPGKKHVRIQRGDRWSGPPPLKNHRNIGLSNSGPDPLKKHKATKPGLNVGPLAAGTRNAI